MRCAVHLHMSMIKFIEQYKKKSTRAFCISVLGTASDVGKSIIATAMCRFYADHGLRVCPFKAQNMSNNSGVTPEGLEMGRAQIVQAEAAGVPPHVDMNPILLKPTGETGSQLVLLGEVSGNNSAEGYYSKKRELLKETTRALDRLRQKYDLVIMEGAGSCAEVNLMPNDIVNFKMAEYAQAPVVLVGDIHRGGVFAQILGTLQCLPADKRDRIIGCIINRFRGDISLFEDGKTWIRRKTAKPVFGVLPWFHHFSIQAEDSVAIENIPKAADSALRKPAVGIIRLPRISNFTDFDPLENLEGLHLYFLETAHDLSHFSAVIIPGSKNTRADLAWLDKSGWAQKLKDYAQNKGAILGICGGFQMMGTLVRDPQGLEGAPGASKGLSLLPVETILKAPKKTTVTAFAWNEATGSGYEIHMGETNRVGGESFLHVQNRNQTPCNDQDGCIDKTGRIMGTYMHGFFDSAPITASWLSSIGLDHLNVMPGGLEARQADYALLADHFKQHIDMEAMTAALEMFHRSVKKPGA